MIYNVIVDTQPAPPGTPPAKHKWEYSLVAELEIDSNPEYKNVYDEGHVLRVDLEGDDWSFSAISDIIREKIRQDAEERALMEARKIGHELQGKITEAYTKPLPGGEPKLIGHIDLWKGTFTPLPEEEPEEPLIDQICERVRHHMNELRPAVWSRREWDEWVDNEMSKLMCELHTFVPQELVPKN